MILPTENLGPRKVELWGACELLKHLGEGHLKMWHKLRDDQQLRALLAVHQNVSHLAAHNASPHARTKHIPVGDGIEHEVARGLNRAHAT